METIVANINKMPDFDLGYTLGRMEAMAEQAEKEDSHEERPHEGNP